MRDILKFAGAAVAAAGLMTSSVAFANQGVRSASALPAVTETQDALSGLRTSSRLSDRSDIAPAVIPIVIAVVAVGVVTTIVVTNDSEG